VLPRFQDDHAPDLSPPFPSLFSFPSPSPRSRLSLPPAPSLPFPALAVPFPSLRIQLEGLVERCELSPAGAEIEFGAFYP